MTVATSAAASGLLAPRRGSTRSGPVWLLRTLLSKVQARIGGFIILLLLVCAIFAPLIAPFGPVELRAGEPLAPPSARHLFGTDDLGRDMFSRLVYGSRLTLQVGALSVAIATSIGVLIGLVAGFYGGWVDAWLMRFTDVMLAFPGLLLALAIVAILGPGLNNAMIAVGVGAFPGYARVVRGSVLSIRGSEYVTAERVLGADDRHIMRRAVLPNVLAPIIVLASLEFPAAILSAAALSFLGLGAQPPDPEWGALLTDGRNFIRSAPWLINIPGLAIFAVVLAFNLLGNTLRDVLDPRQRGR
ncbi:MAG: ABC transporter permease [Chloroflexota bacterium]|nr:ABC transporter permease [Chloroflexota bacterium]